MNREQNSIAFDRENITWKQNYSSGGSRMIQSEPECLAHDGCCETPSPSLPRGSATLPKCGPANSEADSGQPTGTRTLHPILDLHELMSCRDEHLAVIQSEMVELARLAEVGKKLRRQNVAQASALTLTGQMLLGGQQRLEKIGQRIDQLAADINAQQLRLIAAGKAVLALNDRTNAKYAKIEKQCAALDKHVELLAVHTRVAEEALQPLIPPKMSGDVGPSDRGMIDGPSSMQGSADAFAAGSDDKRADEPPVPPMSEWDMHTLEVTTDNSGRSCRGLLRPPPCSGTHGSRPRHECVACERLGCVHKRGLWHRNAVLQWQRHELCWRNHSNSPPERAIHCAICDFDFLDR